MDGADEIGEIRWDGMGWEETREIPAEGSLYVLNTRVCFLAPTYLITYVVRPSGSSLCDYLSNASVYHYYKVMYV